MMFDGIGAIFRALLCGTISAIILFVAMLLAVFGLTNAAVLTAAAGIFAAILWTSSID